MLATEKAHVDDCCRRPKDGSDRKLEKALLKESGSKRYKLLKWLMFRENGRKVVLVEGYKRR